MATRRTHSAKYKRWRTTVLTRAQNENITHCPCTATCQHHTGRPCLTKLNYNQTQRPDSAEPDHIIPVAQGGQHTPDNGQVLCRRCNQSQGDKRRTKPRKQAPSITLTTSTW